MNKLYNADEGKRTEKSDEIEQYPTLSDKITSKTPNMAHGLALDRGWSELQWLTEAGFLPDLIKCSIFCVMVHSAPQ